MLNYSGLKDRARIDALNGTSPPHYPLPLHPAALFLLEQLQVSSFFKKLIFSSSLEGYPSDFLNFRQVDAVTIGVGLILVVITVLEFKDKTDCDVISEKKLHCQY